MTLEKKIEILYDHYKDTFDNQKVSLKKRDSYTLICLILVGILSFLISYPYQSSLVSEELIKKNIGNIQINFSYINNILTFALLWVVILYYQVNFFIEKIYKYIEELESKLTNELTPFKITREGKNYLDHYSWLSTVVHRIYTILFPLTLIAVSIIKWIVEKGQITDPFKNGHFWFNTVFLFCIILTSLLYLSNRHFNDFRKKNN